MIKILLLVAGLLAAGNAALNPFPLQDIVQQALEFSAAAPVPEPLAANKADFLTQIAGTVEVFRQYQNKNSSSPFYGKVRQGGLEPGGCPGPAHWPDTRMFATTCGSYWHLASRWPHVHGSNEGRFLPTPPTPLDSVTHRSSTPTPAWRSSTPHPVSALLL
jgi:hypothetical protein